MPAVTGFFHGGITVRDMAQALRFYRDGLGLEQEFDRILETHLAIAPRGLPAFVQAIPHWLGEKLWIPDLITRELGYGGPVVFPEHHESHAASAFFPALVLGVFWKRANKYGAIAGMLAGLGLTVYYMVSNEPWLRGIFHIHSSIDLWWNIQPISGAVFGVPLGLGVMAVVSLLTPAPSASQRRFVRELRHPPRA